MSPQLFCFDFALLNHFRTRRQKNFGQLKTLTLQLHLSGRVRLSHEIFSLQYRFLLVSGSCSSGQIFTVTSYADLLRQSSDLMCIFASGVVPDGVPSGFVYGRMVSFSNTGTEDDEMTDISEFDFSEIQLTD